MSNLLEYWEYLTDKIDKGEPVDVIYLDLSKAFDIVPHKRLLKKLGPYGIQGEVLNWIKEWLSGRKQ